MCVPDAREQGAIDNWRWGGSIRSIIRVPAGHCICNRDRVSINVRRSASASGRQSRCVSPHVSPSLSYRAHRASRKRSEVSGTVE